MTVSRVVLLAVAATGAWASDTAQAADWFRCSDLIVQLSESFAPISSFLRVPAGGTQ
jgi:hypothetical protein